MVNLALSGESLYMEKHLSHKAKLRKPDLDYRTEMEDLITTGYDFLRPCAGPYTISKRSDEKSIFASLWTQKPDEMIDPTQKDFCDLDAMEENATTRKESKSCEFANVADIDTKISTKMNTCKRDIVEVSKCIVFAKRDMQCGFQGKIFVSNNCEHYVTFRVSSSKADKFRYFPDDIGYVSPKGRREILVQTNRLKAINFEDIMSEVFLVQATTIYRKEQLDMTCLNTLWKAFKTDEFPEERCEQHFIKDVFPKDNSYLENLSLLRQLTFMFCKKIKEIEEPPSICSENFYENWPVNSESYTVMKEQEQTDIVTETIKEIKKAESTLRTKMTYALFITFALAGVSAVSYSMIYDLSGFQCHVSNYFSKCTTR